MAYNKRTWLNRSGKPATGSVVAFEGEQIKDGKPQNVAFLEIADCEGKVKIKKTGNEHPWDYIDKLRLLKADLTMFIKYLEGEHSK